jgi:Uma2 family endonuclease
MGEPMPRAINESTSEYSTRIPPLAAGDVLDAEEFWRRYRHAGAGLTAERIHQKVYIVSPLRAASHGDSHAALTFWLATYSAAHGASIVSDNATIRLDRDNDPQPDLCLRLKDGSARLDEQGYLVGPPEMVVEIAGSSASHDLTEKRDIYEAAGTLEYLVYECHRGEIYWWTRIDGRYQRITSDDRVHRSVVFPGLWLDRDALRSCDINQIQATLKRGLRESGLE